MPALVPALKHAFLEAYREITQQKLKRYRFALSSTQRLFFYTFISIGVLLFVFFLSIFIPDVTTVSINHTDCTEKECSYAFTVRLPMKNKTYIYGVVDGAAQTHMKYMRETAENSINAQQISSDCSPYMENDEWVYPCGLLISTYPQDTYKILKENSTTEIPMEIEKDMQLASWTTPSSFSAAKYKIGEIKEELPPGNYTLKISKHINHPLPKREVLIIGNIGALGNIFSNAGLYIVAVATTLILVNSIGCMYYV